MSGSLPSKLNDDVRDNFPYTSTNDLPNSTHPEDYSFDECDFCTGDLEKAINWTLFDDNYSIPFIQYYTINYTQKLDIGTENERFEFNFTTTQKFDNFSIFLMEDGSFNSVFYDLVRVHYLDLANNSYYLPKGYYEIDYDNKTLIL